jgi:hypothetical protein
MAAPGWVWPSACSSCTFGDSIAVEKYSAPSSRLSAIESGRARIPPSSVRVTSIAVENPAMSSLSRCRFSSFESLVCMKRI